MVSGWGDVSREQRFSLTAILDFSASLEMTSAVRARMIWRACVRVTMRRCVEGAAIFLDGDLRFLGFARNDKCCEGSHGTRRAHGVRMRRCVEGAAIFLDGDLRFLGFARNDKCCEGSWELACVCEGYVRRCVAAAISLDDALRFLGFARNDKCCEGSWELACAWCQGAEMCRGGCDFP